MRRTYKTFMLVALAVAGLAASALVGHAYAGWFDAWGNYHCVWGWGPAGYACY